MRKIVTICVSFVVSISILLSIPLVASASVPDQNVFFDYDKYSTYTYDSTTGNIHAVVSTPQDWFYSGVSTNYVDWEIVNSNLITTTYDSFNYLSFRVNPWFNYLKITPATHTNGRFLDLSYIPCGTMFSFDFKVYTNQPFEEDVTPSFYIIYVDSSGEVVGQQNMGFSLINSGVVDGGTVYDYTCMFPLGSTNIPDSAKGFYLFLDLTINYGGRSGFVGVQFDYIKLHFHYSQLDYNSNNEVIIRDKLSNIENQLGDIINYQVDPEPPAGVDKFDDLQSNEDQLLDGAQDYLDDGIGFFENAVGVFFSVADGFEALKILVAPVFNLPFANGLILVSVSLGLIGTLLGLVSMVASSINRKSDKQNKSVKQKNGK